MKTEIVEKGNQIIATFAGRLDTPASVQTSEDVKPLLEAQNKEIILDCTALEYISSSGLRIFLSIRKEAAAHGAAVHHLVIRHRLPFPAALPVRLGAHDVEMERKQA